MGILDEIYYAKENFMGNRVAWFPTIVMNKHDYARLKKSASTYLQRKHDENAKNCGFPHLLPPRPDVELREPATVYGCGIAVDDTVTGFRFKGE